MAWSKDDKQQLADTGGRVNGHARNGENRRQQYRENRSAHMATLMMMTLYSSANFEHLNQLIARHQCALYFHFYSVSQKILPEVFLHFPQMVGNF